jgi:hypothetical protein
MTGKIFSKWDETHSELWSHQPIRLEHELHKSPRSRWTIWRN